MLLLLKTSNRKIVKFIRIISFVMRERKLYITSPKSFSFWGEWGILLSRFGIYQNETLVHSGWKIIIIREITSKFIQNRYNKLKFVVFFVVFSSVNRFLKNICIAISSKTNSFLAGHQKLKNLVIARNNNSTSFKDTIFGGRLGL